MLDDQGEKMARHFTLLERRLSMKAIPECCICLKLYSKPEHLQKHMMEAHQPECLKDTPKYCQYLSYISRLNSFSYWPQYFQPKPRALALAGFFYTGIGDHVQCFSCGIQLKNWKPTDDPWEEHGNYLSHCYYYKKCSPLPLVQGTDEIDYSPPLKIVKIEPDNKEL